MLPYILVPLLVLAVGFASMMTAFAKKLHTQLQEANDKIELLQSSQQYWKKAARDWMDSWGIERARLDKYGLRDAPVETSDMTSIHVANFSDPLEFKKFLTENPDVFINLCSSHEKELRQILRKD
jgi:hypothetical protein